MCFRAVETLFSFCVLWRYGIFIAVAVQTARTYVRAIVYQYNQNVFFYAGTREIFFEFMLL